MRSLWSHWPKIRKLLAGKNLILLLDFDGTLTPIVSRPSDAKLPAATRAALVRLAQSPRVALGIVSGRELRQLRRLLRLKRVHLIGSHGWEWILPDGAYRSRTSPHGPRQLRQITAQLRRALQGLPKVWIERKIATVAVHCRGAGLQQARAARSQVARLARRHSSGFRLLAGKKVFEFLPVGTTSKGTAVRALVARLRRRRHFPLLVYVGDDAADETVFARMGKHDISIHVGRPGRSCAHFYLRSPEQVCRFLERVCTIIL